MEREQHLGRLLDQLLELAKEHGAYLKVPGKVSIEEENYRSFNLEDCFSPEKTPEETTETLKKLKEKLEELADTQVFMVGLLGLKNGREFTDLTPEDIKIDKRSTAPHGRVEPRGVVETISKPWILFDNRIPPLLTDKLLASLLLARKFSGLAIAEYPHFKTRTGDEPDHPWPPSAREHARSKGWINAKSLFIMTEGSLETLKKVCAEKIGIESDRLSKIEELLHE